MALSAEIIDLIGSHLLDKANQVGGIGEIAVVKYQPGPITAAAPLVGILAEVINEVGDEASGAVLDSIQIVALLQQQFGLVAAVLAGDAGDERGCCHFLIFSGFGGLQFQGRQTQGPGGLPDPLASLQGPNLSSIWSANERPSTARP